MSFLVNKINIFNGSSEIVHKYVDAESAYEAAHRLMAGIAGLSNDESYNEKHYGPFIVTLTDEEGNDQWQHCSRARCPQAGLFQL